MIVYDITRRSTFDKVKSWLEEAKVNGHTNLSFLLIGNKCDLSSEREVTTEEAKNFAFSEGFNFIETSARNSTNVEKAFFELSLGVLQKIRSGVLEVDADGSYGVKMRAANAPKKSVDLNSSHVEKNESSKDCCVKSKNHIQINL